MGADIHAYVEFFSKSEFATRGSLCTVTSFCGGEIDFGRNYNLFGLIAGVRSMNSPLFPVRGLPQSPDLSYTCAQAYYLTVVDSDLMESHTKTAISRSMVGRWVTKDEATKLVLDNSFYGPKSTYRDSSKTQITDPSWHSATHLTLNELCTIRKQYLIDVIEFESELSRKSKKELLQFVNSKTPKELVSFSLPPHDDLMLYSTIRLMSTLENSDSDVETRFVCWFDS